MHVFFQMFVLFMLTTPLITMRLVAEERNCARLEVLLTAPVSETEIVLAKFFASMSLIVLMLLLSASYAVVLACSGTRILARSIAVISACSCSAPRSSAPACSRPRSPAIN